MYLPKAQISLNENNPQAKQIEFEDEQDLLESPKNNLIKAKNKKTRNNMQTMLVTISEHKEKWHQ